MKTRLKKLIFALALVVVSGTALTYCSSDSDVKQPAEDNLTKEAIVVQSKYLADFVDSYKVFVENLQEADRNFLNTFLADEQAKLAQAKTSAICNCGEGMSSCSSEGAFSSCCVCWNPQTHTGACGTYFGIALCRNEPIPPGMGERAEEYSGPVAFHPAKFDSMLTLLSERGVSTRDIRSSLQVLVSQAQ